MNVVCTHVYWPVDTRPKLNVQQAVQEVIEKFYVYM